MGDNKTAYRASGRDPHVLGLTQRIVNLTADGHPPNIIATRLKKQGMTIAKVKKELAKFSVQEMLHDRLVANQEKVERCFDKSLSTIETDLDGFDPVASSAARKDLIQLLKLTKTDEASTVRNATGAMNLAVLMEAVQTLRDANNDRLDRIELTQEQRAMQARQVYAEDRVKYELIDGDSAPDEATIPTNYIPERNLND